MRDFWQNYPKSLGDDGDAVVVGICPLIPKGLYPPSPPQEDKLYYYLVGGEYKLKQGVSKTHELLYYFHKGDSEEARSEDYVGFLEEPLLAVAPTEWYCESKAFGDVAVVNREKFPYYEDNISKALED